MPFRRRVLHYGPGPGELLESLSDRAIAGCWFELRRLGGCGDGEIQLRDIFPEREALQIGDWVACEYDVGDRWYLGRVVERIATSPVGVTLRLEGMASQLETVYPGGFGSEADGAAPHRYGCTELFPGDPDAIHANIDCVHRPEDLVRRLMSQYIVPTTEITLDESLIEDATAANELVELKVRGTETAASILRDLALRSRNASWGVDEQGKFFLLQQRHTIGAQWQEGVDLISLREIADEHLVFNRVMLSGGLIYADCPQPPCGVYRWQGNYLQPTSRELYGERRIRLSIPWIRTAADSQAFVREFFRVYAEPTPHHRVEVAGQSTLIRPWLSAVRVLDRQGNVLATMQPEIVRVQFDRTPKFRLELGPLDPKSLWTIPAEGEVWPIAPSEVSGYGGGEVDVTTTSSSSFVSEPYSSETGSSQTSSSNSSVETSSSDTSNTESSSAESSAASTDDYTDCYGCDYSPREWKLTLAGIVPGLCGDCASLNQEWILERDPTAHGCVWVANHAACGGPSQGISAIRLYRRRNFTFLFIIAQSLYAAKYRPQGNFVCRGANTFELYQASALCGNWPATVVVEPV